MEALVYENSPLAEYLHGELEFSTMARPEIITGGRLGTGEHDPDWPVKENESTDDGSDISATNFAPRGASKFQDRIRNKLPKPLDLRASRQGAALGKLYDACMVCFCLKEIVDVRRC